MRGKSCRKSYIFQYMVGQRATRLPAQFARCWMTSWLSGNRCSFPQRPGSRFVVLLLHRFTARGQMSSHQ
eukprot:11159133-Lingulodinium_polyedra.AAC.1